MYLDDGMLQEFLEHRGCRCHLAIAVGTKFGYYSWDAWTQPQFLRINHGEHKTLGKPGGCEITEGNLSNIKAIMWD